MSSGDLAAQPPHNSPVEMGLDEKQIKAAELYGKLVESARIRFDSRRNLEWRAAIGLWTLFGGASGIVLTTRSWVPGPVEAWVSVAFSIVVVGVYITLWIRWINEAHRRDSHVAYFWETGMRECIKSLGLEGHKDLPSHLSTPEEAIDTRLETIAHHIQALLGLRSRPADRRDTWAAMTDQEPNKVRGVQTRTAKHARYPGDSTTRNSCKYSSR